MNEICLRPVAKTSHSGMLTVALLYCCQLIFFFMIALGADLAFFTTISEKSPPERGSAKLVESQPHAL